MVLVDMSVWSTSLRRAPKSLNQAQEKSRLELIALIQSNRAQLLGTVRQELLSGIRELAQYERLAQYLREFGDVPLAIEDYEQAGAMHNICRSEGISGSSADFLICAVSIRRNWPVLTLDHDFARYASCIPLRHYSGGELQGTIH
jgi:predicted nucleic acid-binding protein